MPSSKPKTDGQGTWISHTTMLPDGSCPKYGRKFECEKRINLPYVQTGH